MDGGRLTQETLNLLKASDGREDMVKAWVQPNSAITGIQNYDLEKPALQLVPVETPLFNSIPIVDAEGGIQANWRAITGINTNGLSPGLSEGNRGGSVATSTAVYFAQYCSFGLDESVTDEANWAARNYMDLLGRAQANLILALKIAMEPVYLGGLGTYGLGQTARPSVADIGTGGTIPQTTTVSVICAALTLDGFLKGSVAGGVRGLTSRTNVDGSTDQYGGGTAQLSQNRTVTTATDGNATHSVSGTTAAQGGAVGYAWFWGPVGQETLGAITTINSVLITTAAGAGTQTAASLGANDNSQNQLVCDGLISMVAKAGMNGYTVQQATGTAGTGTPLTADGEGGIVEIDTDLKYFYDSYRLCPTAIFVSSQELLNIGKKIGQGPGSGTSNIRFVYSQSEPGRLIGGTLARAYLNKFTVGISSGDQQGTEIPIKLHPNLPPGSVLYDTRRLPYPLSGVDNTLQFRAPMNFTASLWPRVKRRYEYGVYMRGVLQNYFIPSFGVRSNIGNG